jgi:hypothetical protein
MAALDSTTRRLAPLALALALAGALAAPATGEPPAAKPAGVDDVMTLGARYFDQSIAWVARGGSLGRARDVFANAFAILDVPDSDHFEGKLLLSFVAPDKMRQERTSMARTITKILDGERAWEVLADGTAVRIHGRPDAEKDLRALKEDLGRMQDLASFLTLEGLKGEGVLFEFQGAVEGSGVFEGKWLKVARRSPDGRKMTFWFAYEKDAAGAPRATWAGVCRVDGDPAAGLWTEDWVLKGWEASEAAPRPYRYPTKIQGWRYPPDERGKATRFAVFNLDDIRINAGIEAARFAPPAEPK